MSNNFTIYYTLQSDHVWRNGLGRPASPSDVERAGFRVTPEQRAAYKEYVDDATRRYAESQRNMTADQEAEHLFELRAAFGPGEEVVDVITGKRWRT